MCIFDYIFHACAHSSYKYVRPTSYICGSDDNGMMGECHELVQDYSVSQEQCRCCTTDSDSARSPDVEDFEGIIDLLERDLTCLADTDKGEVGLTRLARAYRAVQLLSEMAGRYWRQEEMVPGLELEEILGYVRLAVDAVQNATREQRQTLRKAATFHSPAIASGFKYDSSASAARTTRYAFSQGTIDRQLCYLAPSRPQYKGPPRPLPHPNYAPLGWISYAQQHHIYAPSAPAPSALHPPHLANAFPNSKPATDPMRAMLDHCSSTLVSRARESDEDEHSVMTNPFCSTPAPVDIPAKIPPAARVSGAKTYLDGRDNWECDFCGPECFCWGFDD